MRVKKGTVAFLCALLAAGLLLAACDTGTSPPDDPLSSFGSDVSSSSESRQAVQQERTPASSTAGGEEDWLFTDGNRIVDGQGDEVRLTGLNWFGHNTGTNTFDGLWSANLEDTVVAIADRGFNLIRVPVSVELVRDWSRGEYHPVNINEWANPGLAGKNSREIFEAFLAACEGNGVKVMVDYHSASTDAMGHTVALWYNGDVTTAEYFDALAWMAGAYAENDTLIAYDLKNEPHGKAGEAERAIWNGSISEDNWKHVAEQAAAAILNENPDALIVVEGIEAYPKDVQENGDFTSTDSNDYHHSWWGANLRGVEHHPLDLGEYQNKLVYSPHDYGPTVYRQPWFEGGFTYDSLYEECWRDNWLFIHEQELAPLLIGEWGGFLEGDTLTWMTHLRTLIQQEALSHTFWCLNPNSGDTGGLLEDDFTTWDEEKYAFVKEALWQIDGSFVGLDADVPLGANGITRP